MSLLRDEGPLLLQDTHINKVRELEVVKTVLVLGCPHGLQLMFVGSGLFFLSPASLCNWLPCSVQVQDRSSSSGEEDSPIETA